MGTYYRWRCDEKRELFDPGEILGPDCPQSGYGIKASSIPFSAWVVGALATDRWLGCAVRLVGDYGDEYDCDGYEEVSQYVLRHLTHRAPPEELRFLVGEVRRARGEDVPRELDRSGHVGEFSQKEYDEHVRILADHARVDWPPHCRDEDCVHFGERHQGDHVPTRPLPVGRRVRQYAVGLGRGDALPGGEVGLECEVQHDFTVGSLHFSGDTEHFHVVRVSLTGLELPILTGVPTSVAGPNTRGLPLEGKVGVGQKIVVVVRNVSGKPATIVGGVLGTVVEEPGGEP